MPISDLQFQYQAKNQLLSVDLSLLQAFAQCLASAFKVMPLFYSTSAINALLDVEHFLETFNLQYATPLERLGRNASFASLDEADRLLESVLGVTYHHRMRLYEAVRELIQTAITVLADSSDFSPRISAMEELLSVLDIEIDNLIQQINFAGGVAAVTEAAFAQHLHLFTENFTTFYQELAHLSANSTLVQNEELVSNYRYLIRTTTTIKQLIARLFVGNHFILLETPPENLLRFLRQIIKPSFLLPLLKLSRENFENYENQLAHQEEKKLQDFLGVHYAIALRKVQQVVLLKEWLAQLSSFHNHLSAQHEKSSVWHAFQVKKLLTRIKTAYYMSFDQDKKTYPARWIVALAQIIKVMQHQSAALTPQQVLMRLVTENEQAKTDIAREELALQNYSWTDGLLSSLLRIGMGSIYYQWAEALLAGITQFNPTFTAKAIAHPTLQPTLTSGLATIFCGVEVMNYKWLGISYSMLASISHLFSDDINSFLHTAVRCGIEDDTVASHIKHVQWLFGFGINLGLHCLLLGLNIGTCGYATMSYTLATACQSLLDRFISRCLPKLAHAELEPEAAPEIIFLAKYAAQYVGFSLGSTLWRKSYPTVYGFFHHPVNEPLSDSRLLADTQLCHAFKKECDEVVRRRLGLKESDTLATSGKKIRKLLKHLHPDKSASESEDDFVLASLAKTRFVELEEEKSKYASSH